MYEDKKLTSHVIYRTHIFVFNSLGGKHAQAVKRLSRYLRMEAKHKKGLEISGEVEGIDTQVQFLFCFPVTPIKPSSQVPRQPNSYDCGIYLLHFVQTFMSDAKKYVNIILVC